MKANYSTAVLEAVLDLAACGAIESEHFGIVMEPIEDLEEFFGDLVSQNMISTPGPIIYIYYESANDCLDIVRRMKRSLSYREIEQELSFEIIVNTYDDHILLINY